MRIIATFTIAVVALASHVAIAKSNREADLAQCRVYAPVEIVHFECILDNLWGDFATRHSNSVSVPIEIAVAAAHVSAGYKGVHNRTTRALALIGVNLLVEQRAGKRSLTYVEWLRHLSRAFQEGRSLQAVAALRE